MVWACVEVFRTAKGWRQCYARHDAGNAGNAQQGFMYGPQSYACGGQSLSPGTLTLAGNLRGNAGKLGTYIWFFWKLSNQSSCSATV